ncbi:MAG: 3'-5' exonuclease [Actinomycetes bacterium]
MFAVVDTETTGLDPRRDRIVEIALIELDRRGQPVSQWATLVNPDRGLGATHIHGITTTDIRYAHSFERYAGHILATLAGRIIVGHNIDFDVAFLRAEFGRLGVRLPAVSTICTAELARSAGFRPFTLAACCRRLGIENGRAHSAAEDAMATARILPRLADLQSVRVGRMLALQSARSASWPTVELDVVIGCPRT